MGKIKTERADRAIYLKSGSYWVVKRNKWLGPYSTLEVACLERDKTEVEQAPKPEGGPFADFIRKYYYPHYLEKMKTNTQIAQKSTFEHSIIPFFASKKIAEITNIDIMQFQQHLIETGIQASTLNPRIVLLKMVFKRAKELGFIKSNPVDNVKNMREEKHDRTILMEKELLELIFKIAHPYKYAIALAGLAGARAGEVMGFRWEDFDLEEKGKLTFRRQINMAHKIDELKSKGSAATLPMVGALTKSLKEWKEKCPDPEWLFQGKAADYITKIRAAGGGEYSYRYHTKVNPRKRYEYRAGKDLSTWWEVIRKYYGLEKMRFHDFRHSFATNVVTRCANIKVAQKLCRHSNIETTLGIYAHIHPEQLEEVWDWDF